MSKKIDHGAVIGAFSKALNDVGALKQATECNHCGPTSWVNAPLEVVLDQLGGALVDVANGGESGE